MQNADSGASGGNLIQLLLETSVVAKTLTGSFLEVVVDAIVFNIISVDVVFAALDVDVVVEDDVDARTLVLMWLVLMLMPTLMLVLLLWLPLMLMYPYCGCCCRRYFFNALLRKASCVVGRDVEVHVHIVVENVVECLYMHACVDILGCMYAC